MPKTIIDYSKTIIYRIVCKDLTIKDCYIGHTTNFIKRKQQHKNVCNSDNINNKNYNIYVYKFIRDNGGWENWDMILIDTIECNDKNEACKKEREHIELYNATLNKQIPSRTFEEYKKTEQYKIINRKHKKIYRELHKEKCKEKSKEYYDFNKEKCKEKSKEYYDFNKEKCKEYNKKYKEQNKEKIKEQNKIYRESKRATAGN